MRARGWQNHQQKTANFRQLCPLTPDTSDRKIWGFVDFTWRSLGSGANWVGEQDQRNPQYAKIRRKSISAASQKLLSFPTFPLPDQVRLEQTVVIKSPNGHQSYWPKTGCASTKLILNWFLFLAGKPQRMSVWNVDDNSYVRLQDGLMEKLLTRTFSGGVLLHSLLLSKKLTCNQCGATFVLGKVLNCRMKSCWL